MLDVIDPTAAPKYADTADGHGVVGTASVVTGSANTPPSTGEGGARTTRATVTMTPATLSLNARGRAVTFYEEEEEGDEEDFEEASECDEDREYYDDEEDVNDEEVSSGPPQNLKASLLDYVMSEVAHHNQMMDLEHSASPDPPVTQTRPARRQYAYNPEEPQDEPPHLTEYYEQNVIAVLNRCDPNIWGRCLSCGSGSTGEPVSSQEEPEPEVVAAPSHKVLLTPAAGQNHSGSFRGNTTRPVYEVEAFWSYYNYKNELRTFGGPVTNGSAGNAQYHSAPPSPWIVSPGGGTSNNSQHFFPTMDDNYVERMRCNSDLSSGSGSSRHSGDHTCPGGNANNIASPSEMEEGEDVFTFDARLLSEAFLSSGRVDHSIQLMAYHPDYLEIFLKTHHFLLRGDGPLPYNFRNYIAIMAAARYRCSYLMELQKREFLYQGGDPNWLRGLENAPPKLVALYNINKVMAHRPWILKKEDLLYLTKKAGWSLSEVVQAVVLIAHFHSLASFIHGCGITPEVDFDNGHTFLLQMDRTPSPSSVATSQANDLSLENKSTHPQPHGQVSFAVGPPSIVTTTNTLSFTPHATGGLTTSTTAKQTKSILKKTDNPLSTSPGSASSSSSTSSSTGNGSVGSSNATSGGINVPSSVHFHPYHHHSHHHRSSSHSHHQSPCGSLTSCSPVLKSDALHNSQGRGAPSFGSSPPRPGSTVSEVDIIMATMKNLSETSPIEDPEERKKRFETVARSDVDTTLGHQKENILLHTGINSPAGGTPATGKPGKVHRSMMAPDVTPFVTEPEYTYEDFIRRGQVSEMHTFRIQDYSWEEHGYSLVNRLYAEVGQFIDDKFKVAQSMTYYTIGGRANVDTTKFRTAVWNYIQCLYGIRHDDYDYGEVNQLLERPLKAFIKTVCCYPERVSKADYDNVMREFKHSEKVHVNLMIIEAKLQAELLYALKTVMKLMVV